MLEVGVGGSYSIGESSFVCPSPSTPHQRPFRRIFVQKTPGLRPGKLLLFAFVVIMLLRCWLVFRAIVVLMHDPVSLFIICCLVFDPANFVFGSECVGLGSRIGASIVLG